MNLKKKYPANQCFFKVWTMFCWVIGMLEIQKPGSLRKLIQKLPCPQLLEATLSTVARGVVCQFMNTDDFFSWLKVRVDFSRNKERLCPLYSNP